MAWVALADCDLLIRIVEWLVDEQVT